MKSCLFVLGLLMLAGFVFAEVPEHNPDLDYKCKPGFQWSRGTVSCKQADCPQGAGRTYTYDCNCGEAWDKPFKTCYDPKGTGLVVACVASGAKCPGETGGTSGSSGPVIAKITQITGEVECSKDGGKTFEQCGAGTELRQGDFVSTGFASNVKLNFSYGELQVYEITQLRMDEFVSAGNINKTQMYLRVGTIRVKLPHTAAIRGDFSVTTPTAISSIRGSEMKVEYDDLLNKTTVTVLEDEVFVKGTKDSVEITVPLNKKAVIGSNGKAVLSNATATDLNNGLDPSVNLTCCGPTLILLFLFGFATLNKIKQ